jgi:hypothetical protein
MSNKLQAQVNSIVKDVKALNTKLEKLLKEIEKIGKVAPAKKSLKKAAPKKAAVRKAPGKKVAGTVTAYDTVLGIIKKRKKGITNLELIKKTGFDKKKVANLLFKAKKNGEIKSEKMGVYVKA